MEYYTRVQAPALDNQIKYDSRLLFFGSCFTENIGIWMDNMKFNVDRNPFGITYNPVSISQQILYAIKGALFPEKHLINFDDDFVHLDLHKAAKGGVENINEDYLIRQLKFTSNALQNASHIFLTLGTSLAFEFIETGEVINNCHRIPANQFRRVFLEEDVMYDRLAGAIHEILRINHTARIILTISPIRHLRHGAVTNQRSKARLVRLTERLEKAFSEVFYFPVYEIVMDELRDYRFYSSDDYIHLNSLGLRVIKDRMKTQLINPSAYELMNRVDGWLKMKNHRILDPKNDTALAFREKLQTETNALEKIFNRSFS